MAVGKTSVGRLVAQSLGWTLIDSDAEIERREGTSARALQESRGRAALHALEARILLDALQSAEPSVACAAASTIEDERCRTALAVGGVIAVWLQATLPTLIARYDADPHRPRYAEGTAVALREQFATRSELFASVAAARLPMDDLTPAGAADRVLALVAGRRATS